MRCEFGPQQTILSNEEKCLLVQNFNEKEDLFCNGNYQKKLLRTWTLKFSVKHSKLVDLLIFRIGNLNPLFIDFLDFPKIISIERRIFSWHISITIMEA